MMISNMESQLRTLEDFVRAAEAIIAFSIRPGAELELTQEEFANLKLHCRPHMLQDAPGTPPEFMGLRIGIRA